MRLPQRKSEQNRRHDDGDNLMSAQKLKDLQGEVLKLEKYVRPKVVEDLTAAREMGDLSENAAYSHAKGKLMGIDRRLHELKEKIKHAVIITGGAGTNGTVRIGCRVTVRIGEKEKTFEITGSQETDPSGGRISHRSPVGQALLGLAAGDTAVVSIDDRKVTYEIISVE
jgi:transcription elongation factor GreA